MQPYPFETLDVSEVALRDFSDETDYADRFVVYYCHGDTGLFESTNVEALVNELNRIYGDGTAVLLDAWQGGYAAVVDPDRPDALALARFYGAEMEAGQHIDLALFHRRQSERCTERWREMSDADRIDWMIQKCLPAALGLSATPPPQVLADLQDE